ncbi:MAG: hypothetical protein L0332_07400 [Chloroflexi bacterium]|nr:hypothetical protein [Chloroflexota bacterium]
MDQAERRNTTWWTGMAYGAIALVLGWTFFAPHLAGLLAGSLPRLVSLAEFAGRLGDFSALFVLFALGAILLITLARYWFGEEMAQAAAWVMLRLVKPAGWQRWTAPAYTLTRLAGQALVTRLLAGHHHATRDRRPGAPLANPILVAKTARPFLLFQAAPLRIP